MSKEDFITDSGSKAVHAKESDWLEPSVNPFGHGCCDCGLFHQVEYQVVDKNGVLIPDARIQMRWSRDHIETNRLREHRGKKSLGSLLIS
jgi:hypothetical protein